MTLPGGATVSTHPTPNQGGQDVYRHQVSSAEQFLGDQRALEVERRDQWIRDREQRPFKLALVID